MKTQIASIALALTAALTASNAEALSIERNPYYFDIPLVSHHADPTCQLWGKVSSQASYEQMTFNFTNRTNYYRVVSWLDFQGGVKEYATLAPGHSVEISTYEGHPWLVQDARGDCLEVIANGAEQAYAAPLKPTYVPDEPHALAETYEVSGTNAYGGYLNVRKGPGVHERKFAHLPEGYSVKVVKKSNGWGQIRFPNGQKGWVSMKFLTAG